MFAARKRVRGGWGGWGWGQSCPHALLPPPLNGKCLFFSCNIAFYCPLKYLINFLVQNLMYITFLLLLMNIRYKNRIFLFLF